MKLLVTTGTAASMALLAAVAGSDASRADRDLLDASVARLHELYAAHRYTVTQVVRWHLARLHRYNGVYRAVQTPTDAEARRPGFRPGPLWGVPIVVKANMSIKGW